MITCPRCGQQVDETTRTTCPACLTPLAPQTAAPPQAPGAGPAPPAPPLTGPVPLAGQPLHRPAAQDLNAASTPAAPEQAGAPPPRPAAPQPTVRRTLTGEIVQEAPTVAASPPQPGGYAGSAPHAASSGLGVRPAPTNMVTMARRQERPASSRSSAGPIAAVLAVIVVLALAGFGGWWFYTHRGPTPKQQADKFLTSLKALDFKGMYETTEVDKSKYPTEESFIQQSQQDMDKMPGAKSFISSLLSSMQFKTGEATIHGDEATVPVTLTFSLMGRTASQNIDLKMTRVDGIWKVSKNNAASNPLGGMSGGGASGMPGGLGGGASGMPGGF
ncbi:MAG TPA: hypothetical protein VFA07_18550 [Chthonomonadaceae bacterium]|nr:hypothetical protein [Chthonomonadaceae bacterium]